MKKIYLIVAILSFFFSCKEEEPSPLAVETVSAIVQDDGSVLVTGKLLSSGGASGVNLIVAYGNEADPGEDEIWRENCVKNGNNYTAIISDLNDTATYYFRAIVKSTSHHVSAGKIIMLKNIKAKPVVAPCSPGLNKVNHGVGNPDQTFVNIGSSTSPIAWTISTSAKGIFYEVSFEKKPSTGIYTTVEDFKPEGKGVYIRLGDGLSDYIITGGSKVYVNKIALNKWDITVCEAPFVMGLKSKLTFRLQCEE
jgi:hypothetical protein